MDDDPKARSKISTVGSDAVRDGPAWFEMSALVSGFGRPALTSSALFWRPVIPRSNFWFLWSPSRSAKLASWVSAQYGQLSLSGWGRIASERFTGSRSDDPE